MDTFIFSNGCGFFSDLEARLEEKESQNGWDVLFSTVSTKFYLVTDFLWTAGTFARTNRDYGDVGIDSDDNEEVPSTIEIGVLSTGAISALGKFCNNFKCGNCGT